MANNKTKVKVSEKEFNEFYDKYHKLVFSTIRRYLHTQDEIVGLAQEVFLKLAVEYYTIIEYKNLPTYIIVITRRMAIRRSENISKIRTAIYEEKLFKHPYNPILHRIKFPNIEEILEPEEFEFIYELFYLDKKLKDYAKEKKIPLRTAYYTYHRLLKKLKPYLEEYYFEKYTKKN